MRYPDSRRSNKFIDFIDSRATKIMSTTHGNMFARIIDYISGFYNSNPDHAEIGDTEGVPVLETTAKDDTENNTKDNTKKDVAMLNTEKNIQFYKPHEYNERHIREINKTFDYNLPAEHKESAEYVQDYENKKYSIDYANIDNKMFDGQGYHKLEKISMLVEYTEPNGHSLQVELPVLNAKAPADNNMNIMLHNIAYSDLKVLYNVAETSYGVTILNQLPYT